MNKKFRNILSLGAITMLTASSMLPVNALSKTCYKKVMTTKSIYIYVSGVKYKLPLTPSCPNVPSKPESTPNNPSTTPQQKPESTPSTPSTTPEQKPESTPEQKPSTDFSSYQQQVLDLVNAERTKRGISALTLDSNLSSVATKKSQDMVNKNYFDHTSPTYGSPFDMMKQFGISYRTAGENIAKGQKTPQEVVTAWMNSEGHRKNILNPNFTNLGVGIAKDSKGTTYWTQMFIGK